MNQASKPLPRLIDIEHDIVAQAGEWGRQRLQERLQKLADETGEISPSASANVES